MAEEYPDDIASQLSESHTDKLPYNRAWDLCTLFLEGRQWLDMGRDGFSLPGARADGLQRQTINLLLNVYRNILSRLTLSYPSIAVVPASASSDDIIKAKTSEIVLRYYWSNADIEDVLHKLTQWLLVAGTSALHTYYDGSDDRAHTEAISPYDLMFEAKVTSPEDSRWVAIRSYHVEADLKEAYPDKAEEIGTDSSTAPSVMENLHTVPDDRVETFEVYWRDGRHAIITGSTYLFKGTWKTKSFPVQVVRYTEIPGRLWGLGLMQPLLDLQRLYNEQRTQVVHNVKLMANPKWAIPKTSGVNVQALTNKPGEVILFNPAGGAPQQIQPVPLPGYVLDSITRTQAEMHDVAGIHSVTMGKRAVGVSSGRAMEVLTSQDTSQLQETQSNIERAIKDMSVVVLELMKRYYTEPHMVRMLDQMGRVVFSAISSTQLADEPEVFIEAGSAFRFESRDRDKYVLDLFGAGLIDPETAMQELSFRTGNAFVTDKVEAMAHGQKLLEAAKRGYEVEIFRSDDISALLKVFSGFIHTDDFYGLPEERQFYIRDVVVSLENPNADDMQFQQAEAMDKIFPRQPGPQSNLNQQMANITAVGSPQTQGQMAQESVDRAGQVGQMESAQSSMAAGTEALISPVFGGMG